MIFMNRRSRSSRATGPNTRVPIGLVLVVDQHGGVAVEPDVAAVAAPLLFPRPHDHRLDDLPLLDRAVWRRFLDRGGDNVALGAHSGRWTRRSG
jgi:hypothetical protein